jgi:hypothetical protein
LEELTAELVRYRIVSDTGPTIQHCDDSLTTVLFCGRLARVAHLNPIALPETATTFLIPYSPHDMFGVDLLAGGALAIAAFESGSQLRSIAPLWFQQSLDAEHFHSSIYLIYWLLGIPDLPPFISIFTLRSLDSNEKPS